jgi:multicomponent Na+:H+ antiporter subunit F
VSFFPVVLTVIGILALADIARMVVGPTIFDRLLSYNVLSAKVVMAMAIYALMSEQTYMLDIAIVYTLLSFVSTVLIARFVRTQGELR